MSEPVVRPKRVILKISGEGFCNAKARGLQMAIYSDYGDVLDKLAALGIDDKLFDLIIDAPELGALKPSKESARKVMDLLKADPQTTLFVGDRDDKDGESARAVGARFLLIAN